MTGPEVRNTAIREGGAPREICIVMLSAMGDAVHVLPVVNALKKQWPDCRITWVIQPVPHKIVEGHRSVDEFIIFRRRRGKDAIARYRDLRRQFPNRPYDLLISLQVYFKAGLIKGHILRGQNQILQHIGIDILQQLWIDLHRPAYLVACHGDFDRTTTRSGRDSFFSKIGLCISKRLLHFL